jgi:hypothetical protein
MMQRMQLMLNQVNTWSRAMQWAFWAAIVTIAFLLWDATVAELGADWEAQVQTKEKQLAELQRPTTLTSSVKSAVSSFGEVELPREKSVGATAMTEEIQDILSRHRVQNDEYTRTKTNRMKSGSLPGISSSGEQIEQVIGDIRFEATQEEVLKVISELESSPWIDAVSNLRLTKQDGRMIRVDLSVEAWVVSKTQRRGRR